MQCSTSAKRNLFANNIIRNGQSKTSQPTFALFPNILWLGNIIFSNFCFFLNTRITNMARTQPNIIITGTPGVGKTSHCEVLAASTGLKHLSVNHIVKDRGCHDGWDEEYKSWIVDEDKVRRLFIPEIPQLTSMPAAGLLGRRAFPWRPHNRLACLRPLSQKLD